MSTAQLVLSQGNTTQRIQAVASTLPWIAIVAAAGFLVWLLMRKKK